MTQQDWNGQNIPRIIKGFDGSSFSILPILECFLQYDGDTIVYLLPSASSYGWDDNLTNTLTWAKNAYKTVYFVPDFTRYGCLPSWFPNEDSQGRLLTDQGQVDRFLYLLDLAFGGLPPDHRQVDPHQLVEAILELWGNLGEYTSLEEDKDMEWEFQA